MLADLRREYLVRLPLPLAQLYNRAYNSPDARSRHNNVFYLFEAAVKFTVAPLIACYRQETQLGAPRSPDLDGLLTHLALPSLGQWVGMLRGLARHFGERGDRAVHPLGHLWQQLGSRRQDWTAVIDLYRRIKNGPDGQPAGDQSCSLLALFDALVAYRNGVFGHGAERVESFYGRELGPLLFGAVNEIFAESVFDLLGPPGSRLVYLTELRTVTEHRVEVGLRELVGTEAMRTAPLDLSAAQAAGLLPNRLAVLWPGRSVPLRLDPLLLFRESETADDVLFLNRDRDGKQVEYLSYTTGNTERDRATGQALAALLSQVTSRGVTEGPLPPLGGQAPATAAAADGAARQVVLGDYALLAELGRGGMGVIYLARQLSLGRLVALKTLPAELAADATALARFRREIRALARCDHPNVVKVLTSGNLPDGQVYFTMEYVPGCDLDHLWRELVGSDPQGSVAGLDSSTWMHAVLAASRQQRQETVSRASDPTRGRPSTAGGDAARGFGLPVGGAGELPLPPLPETPELPSNPGGFKRRIAQLIRDVASALQVVHDHGLVHRDVKPGNLMLTPDGQRIVLMDFGLVKGQTQTAAVRRGAGFLGTLRYAAPEQLASATPKVGPQADVRGLGVILWEFLTRRRLFADAADEAQLAARVHDDDVPLLRQIDSHLDRDLEAIVARATERSVSARLGSAGLLAEYLQTYLDGQPLPIRPPGPGELLGRWVRRNKGLVAAVTVPLLLLLTIGTATWIVRDAQRRADAERVRAAEQETAAKDMDHLRGLAVTERVEADRQRGLAEKNEREAQKQRALAERLQYAADVNLAQQAFQENRLFRMRELLLRHEKSEHLKGFEWHYLWQLCRTKLVLGPRHQKAVYAVAFSPDGRLAVSGSGDGAVMIWDSSSGKVLRTLPGHSEAVGAVAFSPNGGMVASAGYDRMVKVSDRDTGRERYVISRAGDCVGFSPDSRRVALAGEDNTVVICDAVTGEEQGRWSGHGGAVNAVAFSPDGKWLASASADKTVRIWDALLGKEVRRLQGHDGSVREVKFSPDGKVLVSRAQQLEKKLIVWDPATGKTLKIETGGHIGILAGVSFSPDGRQLASTGADGTVHLHDVLSEKAQTVLVGAGGVLYGGTFSPDGTRLMVGSDAGALIWDLTVGDDALSVGWWASEKRGLFMAQSPDGRRLAASGETGEVCLWDPLTGRKDRTIKGHSQDVNGLAFSPDGRWLVSGSFDKVAKVWRVEDGCELLTFRGHEKGIVPVAYDPGGRFVATGDLGGVIKVWDPRSGRELVTLEGKHSVTGLAFSPDGRRLASVGGGERLHLRDTSTWKTVRTWSPAQSPNLVAYSPDSRRVATGLLDGNVDLWDEREDRLAYTFRGHGNRVVGLAFSPDGRRLVSGDFDHSLRLWDLETTQQLLSLSGRDTITALAFSPDGLRLAIRGMQRIDVYFASDVPRTEPVPQRWNYWHHDQRKECWKNKHWFGAAFHASRLLDLETEPERHATCRSWRAYAAYEQGDYRQTVADVTRALELTKPTPFLLNLRGQAYFELGTYAKAEADLTTAVQLDPKFRMAWGLRGVTRARLRRWTDAIADYTQALHVSDVDETFWRLRGDARAEQGEWHQAVADFAQAVERAPTDRRDLYKLAIARLGRGDLPGYRRACVSTYERLSHADRADDWNNVCWVCSVAANAIDTAALVRLMDKCVAAAPKSYVFLSTRGAALYRAGRHADAILQLNDAITIHGKGGSFEDWVFLAMAEFRLDHADQARDALKRARDLFDERIKPTDPKREPLEWFTRVEWKVLRQEAVTLIGENKP